MRLFGRQIGSRDDDRLPAFLPVDCIGKACPNFTGTPCDNPEMEWMNADGPRSGTGTRPPRRSETNYIVYGQRCLAGAVPELVAQRVEILRPETINGSKVIAIAGMYGDMPAQIVFEQEVRHVEAIATSGPNEDR